MSHASSAAAHNYSIHPLRVHTSCPLQPQTGAERARARLRVCWKPPPRLAHPCCLEGRLWQEIVRGRAQGPHPFPCQAAPGAAGVSPVGGSVGPAWGQWPPRPRCLQPFLPHARPPDGDSAPHTLSPLFSLSFTFRALPSAVSSKHSVKIFISPVTGVLLDSLFCSVLNSILLSPPWLQYLLSAL